MAVVGKTTVLVGTTVVIMGGMAGSHLILLLGVKLAVFGAILVDIGDRYNDHK